VLWLGLASAQPPQQQVTRIIELKNVAPGSPFAGIVRLIDGLGFPVAIRSDPGLRTVVLRGPQADVDNVEAMLKKLDVAQTPQPARNIDLTIFMVEASNKPAGSSATMPADLEPVVKQVRSNFPYQSFRLLDSIGLRGQENSSASLSGVMPRRAEGPNPANLYHAKVNRINVHEDGKARRISLNQFMFKVQVATMLKEWTYVDTGLTTDVELREGQKLVIGKLNAEDRDGTVFLVLTARVVE
jgi:hypothetical protein